MTLASLLLLAAAQTAQKPSDLRVIEVKSAGLSVAVPKSWAMNKKDGINVASFKIPIAGSKNFGRLDIGSVDSDNKDVEGFLEASKSVLNSGGNTIERQWKVDIMDSPLALTRFTKSGTTTVRGVLFRPARTKLVLAISSNNEDFSSVEPYLMSTLETLKVIKVVQPKTKAEPVEKTIQLSRLSNSKGPKMPVVFPVTLAGKQSYMHFPSGTKLTKSGDNTVLATVPGTDYNVTLTAYSVDATTPSLIFQTKAAETADLFAGSIYRIDESFDYRQDKQNRDMIWRTGTGLKSKAPLQTLDAVTTQAGPVFLYASFSSTDAKKFKQARQTVTKFLLMANLTDKP